MQQKQKRPTPKRKRLSLTHDAVGRPILIGQMLNLCRKEWIADILLEYSMFHFIFVHWDARMSISDRLFNNFRAAGTDGRLNFSLSLLTFCGPCI